MRFKQQDILPTSTYTMDRRGRTRTGGFMRSSEHAVRIQQVIGVAPGSWCQEQRMSCLPCALQMRDNRHHDDSVGISRNGALAGVTRMGSRNKRSM